MTKDSGAQTTDLRTAPPATPSGAPEHERTPFIPSENPPVGASTVIGFIVASVLVFGGFYMMGMAFSVPGAEIWLFAGGIIVDAIGLWIAFGLIPYLSDRKYDKR